MIAKLVIAFLLLLQYAHGVVRMDLKRVEGRGMRLLRERKLEEFSAYRKAHGRTLPRHLRSSRAGRLATQPLNDYYDFMYTVNVTFGSPPQQVSMMVETFSGDTWVVGANCERDFCSCKDDDGEFCISKHPFDSSSSSTYQSNGQVFSDYAFGFAGTYGQDTIGLVSDLQVLNVTFGLVTNGSVKVTEYPFDGALGLNLNAQNGVKSVIQEAYDQKLIEKPVFTIFFGTDGINASGQVGGSITYGGVDPDNCAPNATYTPTLSNTSWEFNVESASIGGKTQTGPWKSTTDEGSSLNIVPLKILQDIVNATNAQFDSNYNLYIVNCDAKFTWTFKISGQEFSVDETSAVVPFVDNTCYLGFDNFGDHYDLMLSDAFTKKYCIVYDLSGNIGFTPIIKH